MFAFHLEKVQIKLFNVTDPSTFDCVLTALFVEMVIFIDFLYLDQHVLSLF